MLSVRLAQRLKDAGVRWSPASGDRFAIPQPELDGQVFTLSEMTIQAYDYPTGTILAFNGTTEWAMDSVAKDDALWLPREDQLRDLLGGTFVSLTAERPESGESVWTVTTEVPGRGRQVFEAPLPGDAYALALLDLVADATGT